MGIRYKKFLIVNYALGGAYPVKINAEEKTILWFVTCSFELVKKNKTKMIVDWVKSHKELKRTKKIRRLIDQRRIFFG